MSIHHDGSKDAWDIIRDLRKQVAGLEEALRFLQANGMDMTKEAVVLVAFNALRNEGEQVAVLPPSMRVR